MKCRQKIMQTKDKRTISKAVHFVSKVPQ